MCKDDIAEKRRGADCTFAAHDEHGCEIADE